MVGALAMLCAGPVLGQGEQEPGGEAERLGTAKEIKAEEEEVAADDDWLPGGLSGNVSVYTDYSFRGVSQTGRDMALQGGIDWNHDSGVFVGLWGSSVDFGDAYLEQDFYGGYAGAIDDFSYKVSATFFFYPGDQQFNYWEFGLFGGYDFGFMSASTGVIGSPDYFGTLDTGFYVPVGFAFPLPDVSCPFLPNAEKCFQPTFDMNGGYTHTDRNIFADQHYFDWNAGLVLALPFNMNLDFRYVGTDVKDVHDAGNRFVFGAKYLF
jgi:uncharacterized protein (TIGR02001 family)